MDRGVLKRCNVYTADTPQAHACSRAIHPIATAQTTPSTGSRIVTISAENAHFSLCSLPSERVHAVAHLELVLHTATLPACDYATFSPSNSTSR